MNIIRKYSFKTLFFNQEALVTCQSYQSELYIIFLEDE